MGEDMKTVRVDKWIAAAALGVFTLGGCASIMSGTKQTVSFQSTPEGATVTVSGRVLGKTPMSISLEKQKNQSIAFSMDGYKPITMQLTTQMDSWFWGNIVFGGFIGSTTDGASGAVHMYSPSQYYVTLQPDTKGQDGKTSLGPEHQVRDFVVFNFNRISSELAVKQHNGEMTNALLALLAVPAPEAEAAFERLAMISTASTDAMNFADSIVSGFNIPRGGR